MAPEITRFLLTKTISKAEIESTLMLAKLAAAALHGEDRVRIQATTEVKNNGRAVEIDTTREVGQTLALIFGGYLRQEFGVDAVHVERCSTLPREEPTAVLT